MNRYYAKAESECMPCPPGKYCETGSKAFTGYCNAGYVCVGGAATINPTGTFVKTDTTYADTNNGPCPVGHYCSRGSSFPVPCEPGQYQPATGQSVCVNCPQYMYCPNMGMTTATNYCHDGYVCFGGAKVD